MHGNLEAGSVDEIPIADERSIAEITSFRYTSSTGELLVSTKADVTWALSGSSGMPITEGVRFESGALYIDTKQFPKDTYLLKLEKDEDSKTIEFVFGSK